MAGLRFGREWIRERQARLKIKKPIRSLRTFRKDERYDTGWGDRE